MRIPYIQIYLKQYFSIPICVAVIFQFSPLVIVNALIPPEPPRGT